MKTAFASFHPIASTVWNMAAISHFCNPLGERSKATSPSCPEARVSPQVGAKVPFVRSYLQAGRRVSAVAELALRRQLERRQLGQHLRPQLVPLHGGELLCRGRSRSVIENAIPL